MFANKQILCRRAKFNRILLGGKIRAKSLNRIDGIVTLIMACGLVAQMSGRKPDEGLMWI